jgi:hypothetical protein
MAGGVRPLEQADLPAVAALRLSSFRQTRRTSAAALEAYLRRIFFENPWRDDELPSLVHDDGRGGVVGFVGVIPRRMRFRGAELRAAVSTQFMVHPGARGHAGIRLVQRLFAGPQDLTLADAAPDAARKIWVAFGGDSLPLQSLVWVRALRPARHAAAGLGDHLVGRASRFALRPLLAAWDAVHRPARGNALSGVTEPLQAATVAAAHDTVLAESALRPVYEAAAYQWLLDRAGEAAELGPLQGRIVRGADGGVAGWFLYYDNPGGVVRVLQLCARTEAAPMVIDHLGYEAWRSGAVALRGQVMAPLLTALSAAGCDLQRQGPWALAQSRRGDIRLALARGDAWLTGLDGERWLSF